MRHTHQRRVHRGREAREHGIIDMSDLTAMRFDHSSRGSNHLVVGALLEDDHERGAVVMWDECERVRVSECVREYVYAMVFDLRDWRHVACSEWPGGGVGWMRRCDGNLRICKSKMNRLGDLVDDSLSPCRIHCPPALRGMRSEGVDEHVD